MMTKSLKNTHIYHRVQHLMKIGHFCFGTCFNDVYSFKNAKNIHMLKYGKVLFLHVMLKKVSRWNCPNRV